MTTTAIKSHDLVIDENGQLQFIYSDELSELLNLGRASVRRVSHVEPAVGGGWTADLSPVEPGVVLGPFGLRSEALAAEIEWLKERGY
jgi:hypothetical protein